MTINKSPMTINKCTTIWLLLSLLILSACGKDSTTSINIGQLDQTLPALNAVDLSTDERLQVVATTSIVADIVAQVGGQRINITPLVPLGADSHSFDPTPQDLIALNDAHVIFINGLHLEEALNPVLSTLDQGGTIVSVNAGVETIDFDASEEAHGADEADQADEENEHEHEHEHTAGDPHTWFSVPAVMQWVNNIEAVLSALDPSGADTYAANAAAYLVELEALAADLATQVATIPAAERLLITDHDVLGYLAAEYDFTIVGTIIPSLSTVAAPSAGDLAALQDQIMAVDGRAIFVGVSANSDLAEQIAADMSIQVVPIYTESLSEPAGPADTYIAFMRHNIDVIIDALK